MPPDASADAEPTDAALAERLRAGDKAALEPLYRRHGRQVYRFALLWSGSAGMAADVTQDVFMHLLIHAGDFDSSRGRLPAFLCGIARNFVRRLKAVPIFDPLPDGDGESDPVEPAAGPLERLLRDRDLERLRGAIARLPPPYRDALVLVELQECSYAEAASICGCELGTIRSRLSRARGLLSQWLSHEAAALSR